MKASRLIILIVALVLCGACRKQKAPRAIVTKIAVPAVSGGVMAMADETTERRFEWDGTYYEATVARTADKDLPAVKDADGNEYFDNQITLSISSPSGNIFHRTYRKADFATYINPQYVKPSHSALLNIVFHEVRGGRAVFIATIGSPDERDDIYMPVELSISKGGAAAMASVDDIE
ncbi:MAG: DUF4738 domain-containing protein [Prevotella sp.]|nr:DUF4738 domain-containing protein [Prevotella sp.]